VGEGGFNTVIPSSVGWWEGGFNTVILSSLGWWEGVFNTVILSSLGVVGRHVQHCFNLSP